jgi:hypothetical protein
MIKHILLHDLMTEIRHYAIRLSKPCHVMMCWLVRLKQEDHEGSELNRLSLDVA